MRITLDSFLDIAKRSELLDERTLAAALAEFRQTTSPSAEEAKAFAEFLCRKNLLTVWQAAKLLQGKHRGYTLGRYRLLALLGKGGMSSVYLAEHMVMKRRCAVKVLPMRKSKNAGYLNRFHREARAVAALDHPNIVRAYDIDQAQDGSLEIHFLVMEYVAGRTLFEAVRVQGPLPVPKAADYIRQAALGLDHAHQTGLIHRDVKPENLILDRQGVVKVMDLGLARFFASDDEHLTVHQDERVLGTANYCSPEQAVDSHAVDARSDVYSLGCTLYYLLMGHPPFSTGTLAQRLLAHQTKEPPSIAAKRPDVPRELIDVVRKMMAKAPADRFQTVREVAEALATFADARKATPAGGGVPAVRESRAPDFPAGGRPIDPDEFNFVDFESLSRRQADHDTDSNISAEGSPTEPSAIELFFSQLSDSNAPSDSTVLSGDAGSLSDASRSQRRVSSGEMRAIAAKGSSSSVPRMGTAGETPMWQERRTWIAAGIVASIVLVGWLTSLMLPGGARRPQVSGSERELVVGPEGHFGSIAEAVAATMSSAKAARTIKVASNHLGLERIVLNGKEMSEIPRGLKIVGEGSPRPVLRPAKPGSPILQVNDIDDLVVEGLDFDAAGSDVAIQLSGFLNNGRFSNLVVRGFKTAGIDAISVNAFPSQECCLEGSLFRDGAAEAVGIRLRGPGSVRNAELKINAQRFVGPLAAGIEVTGSVWNLAVEHCIFQATGAGVRFAQSNQDVQGLSITQNTFSACEHGLSFAGRPAETAKMSFARNLFVNQKGVEAIIETGLTPEFAARFAPAKEEFSFNWSDREVPDEPAPGRLEIFAVEGKRGMTTPRFSSTNPQSADYLKPSGDTTRVPSGGFVGAVSP